MWAGKGEEGGFILTAELVRMIAVRPSTAAAEAAREHGSTFDPTPLRCTERAKRKRSFVPGMKLAASSPGMEGGRAGEMEDA